MSGIHFLTIGYIPNDCKSDRISCGDPVGSGTIEVSLMIEDSKITSMDTDQSIEVNPIEFLNEKSKLWRDVVNTFCSSFTEKEIKSNMIGACWAIFMDEISGKKGITVIADESDGGEFHNRAGCHNGNFYLRYQLEEDGEYFGEKVLKFS
jgi:hypothetical protein